MSHIDNGPSPSRNHGEMAVLQILHILASFLECKMAIFFKLFPKRLFTVYNPEIFLLPPITQLCGWLRDIYIYITAVKPLEYQV